MKRKIVETLSDLIFIDQLIHSYVFEENPNGQISARQCWMLACTTSSKFEDEDLPFITDDDDFLFPLLPTYDEREFFLRKREHCQICTNNTHKALILEVMETTLRQFLLEMPEFRSDASMGEILAEIKEHTKDLYSSTLLPYEAGRHRLYLAKYRNDILLVRFEDDCYRPEMYLAKQDLEGKFCYTDFNIPAQNCCKVKQTSVEKLFAKVSDAEINALNEGLDEYNCVEQAPITTKKVVKPRYNIMDHLEQIMLIPVLWKFADGSIKGYKDIFHKSARWHSMEDGSVCLDLNEIRIVHRPSRKAEGEISLREQHRTITD